MRHITDGAYSFRVCDFCEADESGCIGIIKPIGEKGICEECLTQLAILLRNNCVVYEVNK